MDKRVLLRAELIAKLGGECSQCGEIDPRVLQINHLNGGGYRDVGRKNLKNMVQFYEDIVSGKRTDIDLRCANCNILYEYERGARWALASIGESERPQGDPPLRHYIMHSRYVTSRITLIDIKMKFPQIYDAVKELPSTLISPRPHGLFLTRKCYVGLWRNGKYIDNYLKRCENLKRQKLTPLAQHIIHAVGDCKQFIPYDTLLEYLKGFQDDWGGLVAERMIGGILYYEKVMPKKQEPPKINWNDMSDEELEGHAQSNDYTYRVVAKSILGNRKADRAVE